MKTYVIILSSFFPVTHPRAGQPTGFEQAYREGRKTTTIRLNYPLWEKRFKFINKGEACISLRTWTGKPYRSKQRVIDTLTVGEGVGLSLFQEYKSLFFADGHLVGYREVAEADGLSWFDFNAWFDTEKEGVDFALIYLNGFRHKHVL